MVLLATFSNLTHSEKDALIVAQAEQLAVQAKQLLAQASQISVLLKRIEDLETKLGAPPKTPRNSSVPPSSERKSNKSDKPSGSGGRAGRKGTWRKLADNPDEVIDARLDSCPHCAAALTLADYGDFAAHDHIDIPPVAPVVTQVRRHRGLCPTCQRTFTAPSPAGMEPGSPFGPGICALIVHLHVTQMISYERLSQLMAELFGLSISQGAIANILSRAGVRLEVAAEAIAADVRASAVIASDETSARVKGRTWWQWVMSSAIGVYHVIADNRSSQVVKDFLDGAIPSVWVADRYGAQNNHAHQRQVCLAHLLRDTQYAIDCRDTVFAPGLLKLLKRACGIAARRDELKDSTLKSYYHQLDAKLGKLLARSPPTEAGRKLQTAIRKCRTDLFVFLERRDVPCTNNVSERYLRPSVIFRKVTGGFRSEWGASAYAAANSVIATAKLHKISALEALRSALAPPAPATA